MKRRYLRLMSRYDYFQLIFVFVAFSLMVLIAYVSIGNILRNQLLRGAEELLSTAEASVIAGLSEAETTLLNSYYIVRGMIERNAPREEILDHLTSTTEWMRRREGGLLGFYGIYGFIHGEFFDTLGMNSDADFIPQVQLWYQAGLRSGDSVDYTIPKRDPHTGGIVVSAVRNIRIDGSMVGILSLDINVNWLIEYVGSLALTDGGYGVLLSQNLTLMAHPDSTLVFYQLQDLGGDFVEIARSLRTGGEVFAHGIINLDGNNVIVFFDRIVNGWFVGIVTPYSEFYRDLHSSLLILILLGLVLSLLLCFILLRLSFAKIRADEESKAKSSFLARMSHEIRTPMNAITGMAELLLRGEISEEARGYVKDIKQAGNNLISIINDILDFSKIEVNRLEINPVTYQLSSLVNDVVNIIRARMMEKPLRFFTSIDGSIPNNLIGDEVRLRQILFNLLSNSVKYSTMGSIGLSITIHKREEEKIWLTISVSDTGRGIKPEDQAKLFTEYVQFDTKMNRGIEGTGLGLAITKHLCLAMDGDIRVESEYGKGSVFTITIPQGIKSQTPYASVEEPARKKVLVYEGRLGYAKSVCWSLENMGVPYVLVSNHDDFSRVLLQEEWFYVISAQGLFQDRIRPVMENPDMVFPGGKKPPLALMVEWGAEANIPDVRSLFIPVHSLYIADLLNGKEAKAIDNNPSETFKTTRFTMPHARVLIVDDIPINLKVAEALLAPYKVRVDTCTNAVQAIELVKRHNYDIVFMDHMMPGMDGIEATAAIRAWETLQDDDLNSRRQIPIIALTANAVVGMREMFIEKGFNDFLAKPIDVFKLDKILDIWVPVEKKEGKKESNDCETASEPPRPGLSPDQISQSPPPALPVSIPGVDVERGIAMTSGKSEFYLRVLAMYTKEAEKRLSLLQSTPLSLASLPVFIAHAHALKGLSGSIGAKEMSERAAGLESACTTGDLELIQKQFSGFEELLTELIKNINIALEAKSAT